VIFRRAAWHREDEAEVDVQMIVRLASGDAKGTRPRGRQRLSRQRSISFDCFAVVQKHVADAIDVDRRSPTVGRRIPIQ